jgi:hypothetical protein
MTPWYRRVDFYTLLVGAIAELVIGFGWPEQAALLASVAGTVIAALVAGGIIYKADTVAATSRYMANMAYSAGYTDGMESAKFEAEEEK